MDITKELYPSYKDGNARELDAKTERIVITVSTFCMHHEIGMYDCYELICEVLANADLTKDSTPGWFYEEVSNKISILYNEGK